MSFLSYKELAWRLLVRVARGGSPLRRVAKRSKTKPRFRTGRHIYENQKDDKYYSCWNCGFACKEGREECGSNTPSRISYTEDTDYTPTDFFPDYKVYDIEGTGCPLCHSPNWKGKF